MNRSEELINRMNSFQNRLSTTIRKYFYNIQNYLQETQILSELKKIENDVFSQSQSEIFKQKQFQMNSLHSSKHNTSIFFKKQNKLNGNTNRFSSGIKLNQTFQMNNLMTNKTMQMTQRKRTVILNEKQKKEQKQNEIEQIEKVIKEYEALYDQYEEAYNRTLKVIEVDKTIDILIDELQQTRDVYLHECENKKEIIGNRMNYLLDELYQLEDQKDKIINKESDHHNDLMHEKKVKSYKHFYVKTDLFMKVENERREQKKNKVLEKRNMLREQEKELILLESLKKRQSIIQSVLTLKEVEHIEQLVGKWINAITFHSATNEWKRMENDFSLLIQMKENVVILIETTNGQKFGVYIEQPINEIGVYISDPNAFIFKLETNKVQRYPIKDPSKAIKICKNDEENLFVVGYSVGLFGREYGDIVVKKEEKKNQCNCTQSSFEYYGHQNPLIGNSNKQFEIKSLLVLTMIGKDTINVDENVVEQLLIKDKLYQQSERKLRKELESVTHLYCDHQLFDSEKHNWSQYFSEFDSRIMSKDHVAIVIEDTNNNRFGGVILNKIDDYVYEEKKEWKGQFNSDPNAFLFTLETNGIIQHHQFPIKKKEWMYAFQVFKRGDTALFSFGTDICIMKEDFKQKCYCDEEVFDYGEMKKIFTGKKGIKEKFEVKRIVVYQMFETEQQKIEKQQLLINRLDKEIDMKYNEEVAMMIQLTQQRVVEYQWEIEQLEQWTSLHCLEIVFDSDVHNWDCGTSIFDKQIFNKSNLVFVIEDTNGNIFGCYIHSRIGDYLIKEEKDSNEIIDEWDGYPIQDKHAFVFSLYSNERNKTPIKFDIKPDEWDYAFQLYPKDTQTLFTIGSDICIMKKNCANQCFFEEESYQFDNQQDILIGTHGFENKFEVKRIHVWQFYQTTSEKKVIENNRLKRCDEEKVLLIEKNNVIVESSLQQSSSGRQKQQQLTRNKSNGDILRSMDRNEINSRYVGRDDFLFPLQLHHIENFCQLNILNIIYDSDYCDWDVSTSTFDTHLFNREQIVILLEDTNENTFGCFINQKIDSRVSFVNGQWIGYPIADPNAFLFTLKTNGKIDTPYQFFSKQNGYHDAVFVLYGPQEDMLFSVGNGDLSICKKSRKNECSCRQHTYDYKERKTPLVCDENQKENQFETQFEVKRIQVFQMYETDELRKMKTEQKKKNEQEKQHQFEEETEMLETISQGTLMEYVERVELIEHWTNLKYKEVIFDSDVCKWSIGSSTFDKRIYGREKLVFLIEDDNENVFGCYISKQINSYLFFKDNRWNGSKIADKHAFVFTIQSNDRCTQPTKFEINHSEKSEAFTLYNETEPMLFSVGDGPDICIFKENTKHGCYCYQKSFEYQGQTKVFVGKESKTFPFTLKRLQVYQMYDTNK